MEFEFCVSAQKISSAFYAKEKCFIGREEIGSRSLPGVWVERGIMGTVWDKEDSTDS